MYQLKHLLQSDGGGTREAEAGGSPSEASLVYRESSRTVRATQRTRVHMCAQLGEWYTNTTDYRPSVQSASICVPTGTTSKV